MARNLIAIPLGILVVGLYLSAATFTDQDWGGGYVNPGDHVIVQKIKIVDGGSTINSFSIRNLGTADGTDIAKVYIDDDADPFSDPIGVFTDLTGIRTGLHFALDYPVPTGTSYLWIGVEIAEAAKVEGGETIQFQVRFYTATYTTDYITDGSPERIFKGAFEEIEDHSPSPCYLNPGDTTLVQKATFKDKDANKSGIQVTKVLVKNVENADHNDVASVQVKVTGMVGGVEVTYTDLKDHTAPDWGNWGSGTAMEFTEFGEGWPPTFDDEGTVTVEVRVTIGGTVDKHKIQTLVTLIAVENGETYAQSIQASTIHTIRVQGFEAISDVSDTVASGVKSPGEVLLQKVTVTDDDANANSVTAEGIWIRNLGDATPDDIAKIEVKRMDTGETLVTIDPQDIQDFDAGYFCSFTSTWEVDDDDSATLGIYYTIANNVTPGATLQPQVYIRGNENNTDYDSDKVTYPDAIRLYPHGFETVTLVTPPDGGTAYSGQRVLVQKIRCVDIDENDDGVRINPVRVKNVAANPCTAADIEKIEVRTEGGALLGEETDLDALLTGGVPISTVKNNQVPDDQEVVLCIYATLVGPEAMTAGRKLKLETTIFSEENGHTGNQTVTGPEWTLEINHRPTVNFSWSPSSPKWNDTVTFTPDVSDPDGDKLVKFKWDFGDRTDPVVKTTAEAVTHRYPDGGTFTVTLTVTDARGLTGTKSKQITVQLRPNQPPEADFDWQPKPPKAGQRVTFTATATDPDDPPDTPFTYEWDFDNDGTADATGNKATHTFAAVGVYTVTLTVTDSRGAKTEVQKKVTVAAANNPPRVTALTVAPTSPEVKQEITFTATATDPEGDEVTEYEWDFGDETPGETTDTNTVTHTYQKEGLYTVKVRAKDAGSEEFGDWKSLDLYVRPKGKLIGAKVLDNPATTRCRIQIFVPPDATDVKITILDLMGRPILEESVSSGTFTWDLKDGQGRQVPDGLYFFLITATYEGRTVRSETGRILVLR